MKKICVVTAARSEYGLLKWLISDINKSEEFELQLVVTGGHLSYEQGHTVDQIVEDGFPIAYMVDASLDTSSEASIATSMGTMSSGFAAAFEALKPDYVMVLGDRYELLAICSTAFVMRIPIIHLSGGDVTEGAIDDGIRNAVTMLAEYHFPGIEESAKNIIRMRGSDKNVWAVGEPGLDSFYREPLMTREDLANNLSLRMDTKWGLMTYHAETLATLEENMRAVEACVDNILKLDGYQTVITFANADFGGKQINDYLVKVAEEHPDKIKVIPSLGHARYLGFMHQVEFVMGNSSSGITEAPFLGIPVINVGNRQTGRYQCGNVHQCDADYEAIKGALDRIQGEGRVTCSDQNYWGDGHTSERIMRILNTVL